MGYFISRTPAAQPTTITTTSTSETANIPSDVQNNFRSSSSQPINSAAAKDSHSSPSISLSSTPSQSPRVASTPATSPPASVSSSPGDNGEDLQKSSASKSTRAPVAPTKEAIEELSKELKKIMGSHTEREGFSVNLMDDNMFKWEVFLFGFDYDAPIKKDLEMYKQATGRDSVKLEISFPFNYPAMPPFIRVVWPRFHQYTGHITMGGSLCVKDLTVSGWNAKNELTSFVVMIRNLLVEGGALISMENLTPYTETEAKQAFQRVAAAHGWLSPTK